MAVKKDGAACYSFSTEEQSASVGSAVYRDGAGVELVSESTSGPTLSVACPGEAAIVPDHSCDAALYALGGLYPRHQHDVHVGDVHVLTADVDDQTSTKPSGPRKSFLPISTPPWRSRS